MEPRFVGEALSGMLCDNYRVVEANLSLTDINFDSGKLCGSVTYSILLLDNYRGLVALSAAPWRCSVHRATIRHPLHNSPVEVRFNVVDSIFLEDGGGANLQEAQSPLPISKARTRVTVDRDQNGDIHIEVPRDSAYKNDHGLTVQLTLEFVTRLQVCSSSLSDNAYNDCVLVAPHCGRFPSGGTNFCEWFPCFNSSQQSCPWTIQATIPQGLVFLASGVLEKEVDVAESGTTSLLYVVTTPTKPGNIGVVVGGSLLSRVNNIDEHRVEVFCPSAYTHMASGATCELAASFVEFYEEEFECKFPVERIRLVFCDFVSAQPTVFYGMAVINASCHLCPNNAISHTRSNYSLLGVVFAEMFFGCFFVPKLLCDSWLIVGCVYYVATTLLTRFMGNGEARRMLYQYHMMSVGGVHSSKTNRQSKDFSLCPLFDQCIERSTVVSKLRKRFIHTYRQWLHTSHPDLLSSLGVESVCSTILLCGTLSHVTSFEKFYQDILQTQGWHGASLVINTWEFLTFFTGIEQVGQKELVFVAKELLQHTSPPSLLVSYIYNRKRHAVEMTLSRKDQSEPKLEPTHFPSGFRVLLKECFHEEVHTVEVDASGPGKSSLKGEITCRGNKSRKPIRNKCTSAETTNNSLAMQNEQFTEDYVWYMVPDPELCNVSGQITCDQSKLAWFHQLDVSKDPLYQIIAAEAIKQFPAMESLRILANALKAKRYYYGVRVTVFESIIHLVNKLMCPERLMALREFQPTELFKAAFGLRIDNDLGQPLVIITHTEFILRVQMVRALRHVNPPGGHTSNMEHLINAINLLYRLWRARASLANIYLDCCYRKEILVTIGHLLLNLKNKGLPVIKYAQLLVGECIVALNEETVRPTYHYCVTAAALKCLTFALRCEHVINATQLFQYYSEPGINDCVRVVAIKCLVKVVHFAVIKEDNKIGVFDALFDMLHHDRSLRVKESIVKALLRFPPKNISECNYKHVLSRFNAILLNVNDGGNTIDFSKTMMDHFECIYRILFGNHVDNPQPSTPNNNNNTKLVISKSFIKNKTPATADDNKGSSAASIVRTIDDGNKIKIVLKLDPNNP